MSDRLHITPPKFEAYVSFLDRLKSFKNWPTHLPIDKTDMAEAGFVYCGTGDSVHCHWCGVGFRGWESGDIPFIEHAKWSPGCGFMRHRKGDEFIEQCRRWSMNEHIQITGGQNSTDEIAKCCSSSCDLSEYMIKTKPKYPGYAFLSKRLESFENWPSFVPVKEKDLAEAGLVY